MANSSKGESVPIRRGYTLLEILLVLVVLAVVAGMAWPAMLRFVNEQAIKDASEQVRTELDRTRFRAIEAGLMYQFRFEPNGTHYIAIPAERETMVVDGTGMAANPAAESVGGTIAEGLIFSGGPGAAGAGQSLDAEWLQGLAAAGDFQNVQWSAPIYYRPDGTADETVFRIVDESQRYVELSVRGLTGMAKAAPLRQETTSWD